MQIAYYNGNFLPLEEVKIPAMDRGFLFGDGVYEVIPVYAGKLFRLQQHIIRLRNSLAAIELTIAATDEQIKTILQNLVARNPVAAEQGLYIQITRGPAPVRDFPFPEIVNPTIFAYCMPVVIPPTATLAKGVSVITVKDIRWKHCNIKAITLLANILMRQKAKQVGAKEAILINDGEAVEGSSSNLFIVTNGVLVTPPLTNKILGGITRDLILELALANDIPLQERAIPASELMIADEIWLTSSTKEIWPVVELDGKIISNGQAGPLWTRMIEYYQNYKQTLITQ